MSIRQQLTRRRVITAAVCVAVIAVATGFWLKASANPLRVDAFTIGDMDVIAVVPQNAGLDTPPIIFSDGHTECGGQHMARAIARAGYAVFIPIHRDANCRNKAGRKQVLTEVPFDTPQAWDHQTNLYRRLEVLQVMDNVPKIAQYARLAWGKLGVLGVSLGGYTGLGLAGGIPGWEDQRVKVLVALSPYTAQLATNGTISRITIPVMYQSGTNDTMDIAPVEQTQSPKMYIEFTGVRHKAWSNPAPGEFFDASTGYTIAFFDHYLKGKPFPKAMLKAGKGINRFEYKM